MSPAVGFQDATAIAGIAQTAFAKHLEPSETELACQVIVDACADAGIDPSEVDALCSYTMEATEEVDIARNIGCGDITFFSQVGYGGGAGCGVVGHAAMAVATGQAEVAVAWRSRKRGSGPRPWTSTSVQLRVPGRVDAALRDAPARGRDRHADPPLHARVRRHPRPPRQRGHGHAQARQHEPGRLHARQANDPRRLHGGALDLRALVPVRQLPRDRRRPGVRDRLRRAGPGPAAPPVYVHAFAQGLPPSTRPWSTSSTTTRSPGRPGRAPGACGPTPPSGPRTWPWPRSTTPSPRSSCCRSRATGSASGARRRLHRRRQPRMGPGLASRQHERRRAVRGLRARLQPHQRGRAPDAGDLHRPGGGRRDLSRHVG